MPGQPTRLSPWPGGLNNVLPPSQISDQELTQVLNLDYAPDGSLVSRPIVLAVSAGPNPAPDPMPV